MLPLGLVYRTTQNLFSVTVVQLLSLQLLCLFKEKRKKKHKNKQVHKQNLIKLIECVIYI